MQIFLNKPHHFLKLLDSFFSKKLELNNGKVLTGA